MTTPFLESPIFPVEVSYWALGGPMFNTTVVVLYSGLEKRNVNWQQARAKYNISNGLRTFSNAQATLAFFNAVNGRAYGFRFKDFRDYQVTAAQGRMGTGAVGTGYPTAKMYKRYTSGSMTYDRMIQKPVAASPAPILYKNAVALSAGSDYTLDTTTGIATYAATSTKTITGITKANPGVVSAMAHGFTNGQLVYLAGVVGMTQVNNLAFTVAGAAADSFNIGVNTSAYTTYTSGGTAALYPQPADALTFASDFNVPVRFDTDLAELGADPGGLMTWQNVILLEIKPQ